MAEPRRPAARSTTATRATRRSTSSGYKKGADGIRVAPATTGKYAQPAHTMQYQIMVPNSLDFNGDREFSIVQEGFAKLGVKVTQQAGGDSTRGLRDRDRRQLRRATKPTGYDKFDIALWDWFAYADPDFQLSVVDQGPVVLVERHRARTTPPTTRCTSSRARSVEGEPAQGRSCTRWTRSSHDEWIYTQLVNEEAISARSRQAGAATTPS